MHGRRRQLNEVWRPPSKGSNAISTAVTYVRRESLLFEYGVGVPDTARGDFEENMSAIRARTPRTQKNRFKYTLR